jgi:hypothetical protein
MNEYGWNWAAKVVEEEFGGYVNWDEEYFICPECGEPVYADDWDDNEFALATICPICQFDAND